MKYTTFRAMGTNVEIMICESSVPTEFDVNEALRLAEERMRLLETRLSRFRDDSEVSRINSQAGCWTYVSPDTLEILLQAEDAFIRTQGFFNPFMGQTLEDYGYCVSFEHIERETGLTLAAARPFVAPVESPLHVDANGPRAYIEPGYKMDLGGIAKGWIVEQTAQVLMDNGVTDFICNAGGDLVCRGSNAATPWVVGITDPFDPQNTVMNLDVRDTCVATSGTYRRKWSLENKQVHHILDPFLGQPVDSDIVSCTVIHPKLSEAEVLAKVALILGTLQGIPWLEKQSVDGWVMILNTGEVRYSCN